MIDPALQEALARWAATKPTIEVMYIFGSRAKGMARPSSDLDLAFDFIDDIDNADSELIENAAQWKHELTKLTGFVVKDVYPGDDEKVGPERTVVYRRSKRPR